MLLNAAIRRPPDLVLASVELLQFEQGLLLKTLRRRPRFKSIPILGIAEEIHAEDVISLARRGASGFILCSEFTIEGFLDQLSRCLEASRLQT